MSSASPRNFLCSRTHSCAAHFFCALASVNHMDASNARRTPIVEPHDRLGGPDGLAHRLEEALHGRSSWVKCGLNHSRERGVTVAQRMPWPPQRGPGGPPGEVREARPGDPRPSDHHPGWCLQHPGSGAERAFLQFKSACFWTGRCRARWCCCSRLFLATVVCARFWGVALGSHIPHCSQLQWPPRSWGDLGG